MTPLRIGSIDPERSLKQRRVDEDRIQPLTLPYDRQVLDAFVGVDPDDAWLPLCIALVTRLYRVWLMIAGGRRVIMRQTRDEYLYQVLRESFVNVFQLRDDNEATQKLVRARLPKNLPTAGVLTSLTLEQQAKFDDKFQSIQNALITDAIRLDITPDMRTVEDALTLFDRHIDKQRLVHAQDRLEAADANDFSEQERKDLIDEIRQLRRQLRTEERTSLAMAIEVVARLRSIWELLYPDTRALQRYRGDEATYQAYRHLLLRSLGDPDYRDVHDLASEILPRLLPLTDELSEDNPVFEEMPKRLELLRNEIVALASQLHEPVTIDYANQPDLDEAFDAEAWEWASLKKVVGTQRAASTVTDTEPRAVASLRRGRPATTVTYEEAAEAWWHLYDEFGDRPPTQPELTEYLTSCGIQMKPRTLRDRIPRWKQEGKPWPPPEDRSSAA